MRMAFVSVLLVLAAPCASAETTDHKGRFGRSADDMSMCVGMAAHTAHPELEFDLNVTPPQTLGAKKYKSDLTNIWVAEFHEAGGDATDVVLRNVTASPADLDEIWRFVQQCGR